MKFVHYADFTAIYRGKAIGDWGAPITADVTAVNPCSLWTIALGLTAQQRVVRPRRASNQHEAVVIDLLQRAVLQRRNMNCGGIAIAVGVVVELAVCFVEQ